MTVPPFRAKSGYAKLSEGVAEALRPRARPPLREWIPSHLRLPADLAADPGPLRLDGPMTFLRGIVEAAEDPDVREISIMASSQIGKTTTLLAIMLGASILHPAPAILVTPDRDSLRDLLERAYKICECSSDDVSQRLLPEHLRNDLWIDLQLARIHLAYSGNKQRLSGKPACRCLMTEVDRYDQRKSKEGDTMALAEERTKMFARPLILRESTPTIKGHSRIEQAYIGQSNRSEYRVPCPHCGHFQALRFWPHRTGRFEGKGGIKGLKDEAGNWLTPDEVRATAFYQCESCGERINDLHKTNMIERGLWVPHGCHVEEGQVVGQPTRHKRHSGFHLSTLYAPADRIKFGDIAAKYVESKDKPKKKQSFVNNWLGLAYEEQQRRAAWEDIRSRLTTSVPRGQVHPEGIFLTAGVDVQSINNGTYYVVRAWWVRKSQCTSCLVEHGRILPKPGSAGEPEKNSDLVPLDDLLLNRKFEICGRPDLPSLSVRLLLIDTGHRTHDIYEWIQGRPGGRVKGVKGEATHKAPWRRTTVEHSPLDGKPIPGGQELWLLDVDLWKEDIQDRWATPLDAPGAWLLCTPTTQQYLQQVTNEAPRTRASASGGIKTLWTPIEDGIGVDYWDCEVYARCGAEMVVGLHGWHNLPQLAAVVQQQQEAKKQAKPKAKPEAAHKRIERPGGWATLK